MDACTRAAAAAPAGPLWKALESDARGGGARGSAVAPDPDSRWPLLLLPAVGAVAALAAGGKMWPARLLKASIMAEASALRST